MFLEAHKIAPRVLGRPFVTEYGVNTLLRFIHMISLANDRANRTAPLTVQGTGTIQPLVRRNVLFISFAPQSSHQYSPPLRV